MKRQKKLLILLAAIIVLCGVIAIENVVTQHIDSINTTDEIILSIEQDTLTAVSWTYEDETLTFELTDDVWYDSDDADFPVNQETMSDFLSWFEEVHACFIIDDVTDYSQYGLEEPQCTITLQMGDEETVVSVGDYSTMDEQRYIEIGDGKVYLVEEDILESVTTDRDSFMQQDEIPAVSTLEEMTVSGETQLDVVYDPDGVYSYTDSYNYYETEDGNYQMLDDSLVESYLSALCAVGLSDYVTYTASDEDLSAYGLDDPAYTISVTGIIYSESGSDDAGNTEDTDDSENSEGSDDSEDTSSESSFVLYIGVVTEESEESEEETDTAYLRVGDSEIIYRLSDTDYETMTAVSYNDFRPTSVLSADWEEVTAVSFTIDEDVYEITAMDKEEYTELYGADEETSETEDASESTEDTSDTVYLLEEQKVDFAAVMDAADLMTIDTFTEEKASKSLELSMTLSLDREDYSSVEVSIYQYDSDSCLVVVDGETVGLIARSQMVDLREAMTAIVLGLD